MIENAVLTHVETPTHGDIYAEMVYTFFAAAKADGILPVKLKVKKYRIGQGNIPKNIKGYFEVNPDIYSTLYDAAVLEVQEIEESSTGSAKYGNITVAAR